MNGCVVKGKMLRVTPRSHYARVLAFKILPEFVLETQEGRFIFFCCCVTNVCFTVESLFARSKNFQTACKLLSEVISRYVIKLF